MGQINVEGVGIVDIKGDTPTYSEMAEIQKTAESLKADNIVTGEAENETENFFKTPAFGRLVLEAGLSIGGAVATGGLALPAIAARAGFLARPFLTQLAKSALGSAAGGGSGAAIAQTFDPRENVGKEIVRGATEGALAEIVGAPLGIKAAMVISKGFSMPMKHPKLLEGALLAEKALVGKSRTILLQNAAFKGDKTKYNKLIDEFNKTDDLGNIPQNERVKFNSFEEASVKATEVNPTLLSAAEESKKGLTAGVKTNNRALEIIENISQKSLIGGGAISKRYASMLEIGDELANDFVRSFSVQHAPEETAKLLFDTLTKTGTKVDGLIPLHKAMSQANYEAAFKLAGKNADKPMFPFEKVSSLILKDVENFSLKGRQPFEAIAKNFVDPSAAGVAGNAMSLKRLIAAQSEIGNEITKYYGKNNKLVANLMEAKKEIDKMLAGADMKRILGSEAGQAFLNAKKFMAEGEDIFRNGIIQGILKAGDPKTRQAIDGAYRSIVATKSGTVAKELLDQIGKLEKLKAADGTQLLTKARATELRESLKGAYVTDIFGPSGRIRVQEAQYGTSKIAKKKFDDLIVKEGKLARTILGDQDFKRLKDLNTQIAFSQGDLTSLGGIPGGVLIQLKQAGAAGNILQMVTPGMATAGQVGLAGAAGFAGLPFASLFILTAPWFTAKALANPKTNRLLFPRAKDLPKGFVKNPKNEADKAKNYSLMFRALVNGMYKEGYIDDAERDRANARLNNFNNAELIDIDAQINRTQADRVSSARQLPSLPDINVSSPQSFSGFGGTSGQGSRLALAGNDPLLQGIASRSLAKGGILDAKKN
jgi:hypothetical protein